MKPPSQHPEGPAVDREDSRESLAQELREGLRKRGFWAPASGSPASDVITAVFRAIEDRDAKWTNALDDLRGKEEDLSYYRKENLKAEAELAALRTRVKVLEEALRVYARRYESEGGTCWNWTQRVCDSFSGEVDHFDYIGSEQDAPWEIAERALAAVALPVPPAEKREEPAAKLKHRFQGCCGDGCGYDTCHGRADDGEHACGQPRAAHAPATSEGK